MQMGRVLLKTWTALLKYPDLVENRKHKQFVEKYDY